VQFIAFDRWAYAYVKFTPRKIARVSYVAKGFGRRLRINSY